MLCLIVMLLTYYVAHIHLRDSIGSIHLFHVLGILDAAVMGGIRNYEEVFFTSEYETRYPEDQILIERLKDLIAEQVPLLDLCVQIHKQKAPENLQPLQKRFEECFSVMKLDIEEKYGKKVKIFF